MAERAFNVSEFIEGRGFSWFLIRLVVSSWFVTLFDGFDMNVIAYAAPHIAKEFAIDRAQMGTIFSVGLVGTMAGGFLFGYIGDRIGRRPTILITASIFTVLTLAIATVTTPTQLIFLRFLNGVAVGGMLPVIWALNIEYAPQRFRSTVVTMIMLGYSLGAGIGGPLAIWLIPLFGWRSLFVFGSAMSLAAVVVLALTLPESIKFLAIKGRRFGEIACVVRSIDPSRDLSPDTQFVATDKGEAEFIEQRFRVSLLFKGPLRWITPLLWIAYIASSMAVFFIANWTPLLAEALGETHDQAAISGSFHSLGGALGGLLLMRFIDNRGAIAITAMPLLALPVLLVAGTAVSGHTMFLTIFFLIGMFIVGGHIGLHSIAGIFYPTAYRSNGAGWATSVAKIGSILGPWIGGLVLSTRLPPQHMFWVLAVCPLIVAVCIFILGRIHKRILRLEAATQAKTPFDLPLQTSRQRAM
jgi:MFS transporter, AAHS family, 4-hydroxybenzoate transporter